ncbi:MAG: hypothetical protein QM723_40250 [Myxococcaceae bacterium]
MSSLVQAFLPSKEPPPAEAAKAYLLDGVFFDETPRIDVEQSASGRFVQMRLRWRADRAPMVLRRLEGDDAESVGAEAAEEAERLGRADASAAIRSSGTVLEWQIDRDELEADDDAWGAFKAWEAWVLREAGGWLYSPPDGLFDSELRPCRRTAAKPAPPEPPLTRISSGELELELEQTPFGPLLASPPGNSALEPLIWVVNGVVQGDLEGLESKLTRGETCTDGSVTARVEADGICALSVSWRETPFRVRRQVLLDVLAQLSRLRAKAPKPPAPWVFRPEALGTDPHPDEREMLAQLELRAEELERLAAGAKSVDERAGVHALRRLLLAELDAYGLLTPRFSQHRLRCLDEWKLPRLASYQRAAVALAVYQHSAERSHRLGPATASEPRRVSLDWFRDSPATPPDWSAADFLAFCERSLRDARGVTGQEGQLFVHQGGRRVTIDWRCDDGVHACVVSAKAR